MRRLVSRARGWLARRSADLALALARRERASGPARRFLAAQPPVLAGVAPGDELVFLIEQARTDLVTAVLDVANVHGFGAAQQFLRVARARARLWLIVKAADAALGRPSEEEGG
ncbi:MAG: hypothetical protein JOY70_09365 [Acidisphaera sp.]|nr:hypothetical protein [Acidisphaera sp.]